LKNDSIGIDMSEILRQYSFINELLSRRQSVLVLGPRATGKTFFLSRLVSKFSNRLNINLLNSAEYERYISAPERLYDEISSMLEDKQFPLYVMVDEIQRIPQLLNETHRAIEDFKNKVVFILTGSSARKLRRDKEINLLAGRAITIDFFPLNHLEVNIDKYLNRVLGFGTLPEIFLLKTDRVICERLKSYVGTYLNEEIQRESEIRNIDKFHRFLEFSASLNGSLVNYSKIARAVGVTAPTVRDYFQILKDTKVVYEIPAWTFSIKKQIQQSSKYYFFDNGILNALQGEVSTRPSPSSFRYGKLFENFVVTEFVRTLSGSRSQVKLYNYQTLANKEVDLVLQRNANAPIIAVEIKSDHNPKIEDVSSLVSFSKDYPEAKCIVLCRTPRKYSEGSIKFFPYLEGLDWAIKEASK
jgi:uncharacterized protein